MGRETEEQLVQRIQSEQNPVKKAKDEIKLASLKLTQVREAYSQGHIEEGAKLLVTLTDTTKASWKILQNSGRRASKQPEGFRELEIALREDVRTLQDVGRTVRLLRPSPLGKCGAGIGEDAGRGSPRAFSRGASADPQRFGPSADGHESGEPHGSAVIAVCAPC